MDLRDAFVQESQQSETYLRRVPQGSFKNRNELKVDERIHLHSVIAPVPNEVSGHESQCIR